MEALVWLSWWSSLCLWESLVELSSTRKGKELMLNIHPWLKLTREHMISFSFVSRKLFIIGYLYKELLFIGWLNWHLNANAITRGTAHFLTISFVPRYPRVSWLLPCAPLRYLADIWSFWPIFGRYLVILADIWSFWPIYLQKMPNLVPRLQTLIKILTVPRSQKLIN